MPICEECGAAYQAVHMRCDRRAIAPQKGDRVRFRAGEWLTGTVTQTDVPVGPGLICRILTDDNRETLVGLRQLFRA